MGLMSFPRTFMNSNTCLKLGSGSKKKIAHRQAQACLFCSQGDPDSSSWVHAEPGLVHLKFELTRDWDTGESCLGRFGNFTFKIK